MPTKKTDQTTDVEPEVVEQPKQPTVCGHINLHARDVKGKQENLACTLPPGHSGDHFAVHKENVPDYEVNEKGQTVKVTYRQEDKDAWWGDAAGYPIRPVGEVAQTSLGQKELIIEIMNKNSNLTYEQALAAAKATDKWLRLSV